MTEPVQPLDAQEFVSRLRSSKESYETAAVKEGQVWGKVFSNVDMNKARAEDQQAAQILGIAGSRLSLPRIAGGEKWRFQRGLSLACGSGRAERQLIGMGVCESFVGIDISAGALDEARKQAAQTKYDIEYREGDLNRLALPENEFDLAVTQNCLHHVLELEQLAEQIWRSLKPGGFLWIDDFIGETQFQWLDKRLTFVNRLLDTLPEQYRQSALTGKPVGPHARRPPGQLASPFEAIRSAEIVPVFERFFEIERRYESNAILHLICPVGVRRVYSQSEEGQHLFALLQQFDRLLIETDTLPPLAGQYLMKRREAPTGRPPV